MRKMKDSKIEWIGQIPENWNHIKLLYCLRQQITDGPHETPELVDEGIPFISVDSLNESKNIDFGICKKFITEKKYLEYSKKANLKKGDILFSKAATIGKTAIVGNEKFMVWSPLAIIKNDANKLNNMFLYYLLNCNELITAIALSGSYNTQINVGMRELERAIIPLPSLSEQQKIADFLDDKCSKIDSLYSDIEKQIEVLKEYKKSIIAEAITKGLDKTVEMKDSGVEWIGMIPKQWNVNKGKFLFTQRSQKGNNMNLQLLSPTQKYGVIPQEKYEELSGMVAVKINNNVNLNTLKTIHKGDFCISLRSFQGGFEFSEYEGVVSPAYQIFYPFVEVNSNYYKYLFKEQKFIEKINSYAMSLRDGKNIAFSDFGKTYIPIPPIKEQEEIASFLDKKCSQIDEIISLKEKELETLEGYKKSLIYEYVTGKKEIE